MEFIAQGHDSCCFVYAVANFQIYCGRPLPDLERAKDIACCRTGATIYCARVVEYFGAALKPTTIPGEVLSRGGILQILHPIVNGHSLFIYPENDHVVMVNSWLGPLVQPTSGDRLLAMTRDNLGAHWVRDEYYEHPRLPAGVPQGIQA